MADLICAQLYNNDAEGGFRVILKDFELKHVFTADWNGIYLIDSEGEWRRSGFYEGEGIAIPPEAVWPITLYALGFSLLDTLEAPKSGQYIQLVGLTGKRYPVVLYEGVTSLVGSISWVGEQPLLYGFGVISAGIASILDTDIGIFKGCYAPRKEV